MRFHPRFPRLHPRLRRRPSAAVAISSAALFVSLSGVGYAAVTLPSGSVGSSQLRNGAVTYKKIQPGAVGNVRANTSQLQERIRKTCVTGTAISAIGQNGIPTCSPAFPAEYGTTDNAATVTTSPTAVTTLSLPAGSSYLAFANPTATVTSGATIQHVTVSCTLTVGSNTETRSATVDTTGTANQTSSSSIPLELAGQSGTAAVSCSSTWVAGPVLATTTTTTTATTTTTTPAPTPSPAVSVTATIRAIQTSGSN